MSISLFLIIHKSMKFSERLSLTLIKYFVLMFYSIINYKTVL